MRRVPYLFAHAAIGACMWAIIVGVVLAIAGHGTDVFVVGTAGTLLGLTWIGNR